ncbi:MAG: ABC transporter permease [Aestuariivirga sp.]
MRISLGERLAFISAGVLTALVFLVLYSPVIISALFSALQTKQGVIQWNTISFSPYFSLWSNESVLTALYNTGVVAVISVIVASVLSVALALYTEWEGALGRRMLEVIIYIPFLLPPMVTGLALLVATAQLGVRRGLVTIIVGHTIFVLAVTYRLVLTRLKSLPLSMIEASADLGASRMQTLRYVLLPHLASALVTGGLLAATLSFDETLISTFVAGDQTTLPLRLWAMMRVGFTPEINALVTLVLLFSIMLALAAASRMQPRGEPTED